MKPQVVIWWLRRDLRLKNNETLKSALDTGLPVVPLFIIDPDQYDAEFTAEKRKDLLLEALSGLNDRLEKSGSRVYVVKGNPSKIFRQLREICDIRKVFAEEDYSPFARKRDADIAELVDLDLVDGLVIQPPDAILNQQGKPYQVYSAYRRVWLEMPVKGFVSFDPGSVKFFADEFPMDEYKLPEQRTVFGVDQVESVWQDFVNGRIDQYGDKRDLPAVDGTARVSAWLKFGILSIRKVFLDVLQAEHRAKDDLTRTNIQIFRDQLIWRDFYYQILFHYPNVMKSSFRPEYNHITWQNDEEQFKKWKDGQTGIPIVDAGMRQLKETGWMHNRLRMITASFLVKNLLINWQYGEKWFRQMLIDYDPAANNGGWQWTAGTGTDAAPYFRVFNPVTQGKRFDKKGEYVRKWVPELSNLPEKWIHTPSLLPEVDQLQLGFTPGLDYPIPMVDLKTTRERAIKVYQEAKSNFKTKWRNEHEGK